MPVPDLYLFKAARRPLYRKENLHLLAAERGAVAEVAYNRTWVDPEHLEPGAIPPGTRVHVIFTDRPYDLYVPVRQGEVITAVWEELMLRMRIVLGNWIGVEDDVVAAAPPALETSGAGPLAGGLPALLAFTAAVKAAAPAGRVPGEKFVAPKRDAVPFAAYYDDRADRGWRQAVDHVLALSRRSHDDPYGRSVFFRPLELRVNGEPHAGRRVPLAPGDAATLRLGFYNPHLGEDHVSRHELRVLAPEDALTVAAPARFPATGEVDVELEVHGPDPTLTVQIAPAPAEHTVLTERLATRALPRRAHAVAEPYAGSDPAPYAYGAGAPVSYVSYAAEPTADPSADAAARALFAAADAARAGALRAHDVVFRHGTFEPAGELAALEAFLRLAPDEPRLAERRALLLHRTGNEPAAWDALRRLDPALMGDDARFLLFRLHLARAADANPVHRVQALDLTAETRFGRFIRELDDVPPAVLARLVPPLVAELPRDQLREFVDRVAARLESPDALAETARNLYLVTDDPAWAYAYLEERQRTLHLGDAAVIDALTDLAAAGGRTHAAPGLTDESIRRIANLIERNDFDVARQRLRVAGEGLGRADRGRLYHQIADRLVARGSHDTAAEVMVELAWSALKTGDLADASEAVERARGVWAAAVAGHGGAAVGGAGGSGGKGEAAGMGAAKLAGAGMTGSQAAAGGAAGPQVPDWLRDAAGAVAAAWQDCKDLIEWRKSDDERREAALRARYLNKRILIAGGFKNPEWIEKLRGITGAAAVDWAEKSHDQGDDLASFAARIRAGHYDIVLYYLQKSGHEVQYQLKPACRDAGVPWAPTTTAGWRGVVEALEVSE